MLYHHARFSLTRKGVISGTDKDAKVIHLIQKATTILHLYCLALFGDVPVCIQSFHLIHAIYKL